MEAFIFFAFIAFLVFPALMKGQKKGNKKTGQNKYTQSQNGQPPNAHPFNAQWGLQNTSVRAEDKNWQYPKKTKASGSLQQLQTLAARLAENEKKRKNIVQSDEDGTDRNKSGIAKVKFLRGEILDLNRSRRKDWGERHKGDYINGKSVLVVSGIIIIALYVLTRLPNTI